MYLHYYPAAISIGYPKISRRSPLRFDPNRFITRGGDVASIIYRLERGTFHLAGIKSIIN